MKLEAIRGFINSNGLAVFILLCVGWCIYKIYVDTLKPFLQKKLNNTVENQDNLQDDIRVGYFNLVEKNSKQLEESRNVNQRIIGQLEAINITNKELAETNKNLVDSYGKRISTLEKSTEDICKTVEKINTKIDVILK